MALNGGPNNFDFLVNSKKKGHTFLVALFVTSASHSDSI